MAVLNAPPVPLTSPEPTPITGPTATSAEVRAAGERLDLHADRDVTAARMLAARLGQLAGHDPAGAPAYAQELAHAVNRLAAAHACCTVVGCRRCLYLADAAAIAAAWRATWSTT